MSQAADVQFKTGDRVLYVPDHAGGNAEHPDCEAGEVVGRSQLPPDLVYVRFYGDPTPKSVCPARLIINPKPPARPEPVPLEQAEPVRIKPRGWYQRFDGQTVGPAKMNTRSAERPWLVGGLAYDDNGKHGGDPGEDLARAVHSPAGDQWQVRMITLRMGNEHADTLIRQASERHVSINTHLLQTLGFDVPHEQTGNPRGRKPRRGRADLIVEPPIDADFFKQLLPLKSPHNVRVKYEGFWGWLAWEQVPGGHLVAWVNGELLRWQDMQRSEFRRLVRALGIDPPAAPAKTEEPAADA